MQALRDFWRSFNIFNALEAYTRGNYTYKWSSGFCWCYFIIPVCLTIVMCAILTGVLQISIMHSILNRHIELPFRVPCIVIYSYNKSQQDALFLNFILVKNSTYFGQTACPSLGVLMLYSQQLLFVILVLLTVC